MTEPEEGDLRIWYVPQVPMPAYTRSIESVEEGFKTLEVIYELAIFEFENKVKPDFCNMGVVARYEIDGAGGFDWYDVDEDENEC